MNAGYPLNSADTHLVEDVCEDHEHEFVRAGTARFCGFDIVFTP